MYLNSYPQLYIMLYFNLIIATVTYCKKFIIGNKHYHYHYHLLNKNVKAQVKTKYGLARIITMEDNIRQGGVLSVTEYAKMIDDMCEILQNRNLGTPNSTGTSAHG